MSPNQRGHSVLKGWQAVWNEPDQFEWITAFLRERGLLAWARRILSAVAASAALIPLTVLISERRPTTFLLAQAAGLTLAITMAVFWLIRWPTRRQSQTAAILGLACIAVWSQAQRNIEQSVPICMAAAITGGYLAFYHGIRLMITNSVVAVALDVATTYRLAMTEDVVSAARAFWLIWLFNLTGPPAAWAAVRAIRAYVTRANEDPLTGVLNRRAFIPALLADLTLNTRDCYSHLTIVMIDLDDFKSINDTYGHQTGDDTLITVADLLRRHAGAGAAICRAGGEEFIIALVGGADDLTSLTARLCQQIAGLSPPVTASIGTVTVAKTDVPSPATAAFIQQLISRADATMYTAKRNGGNHARHVRLEATSTEILQTSG